MKMREQNVEMMTSVTVRHYDGHAVSGRTVTGSTHSARQQVGVLTNDLGLRVVVFVIDIDEHATSCIHPHTTAEFKLYLALFRGNVGALTHSRNRHVSHSVDFAIRRTCYAFIHPGHILHQVNC